MTERSCYRVHVRIGDRGFAPIVSASTPAEAERKARDIAASVIIDPALPWTARWQGSKSSLHWKPDGEAHVRVTRLHPDDHVGDAKVNPDWGNAAQKAWTHSARAG